MKISCSLIPRSLYFGVIAIGALAMIKVFSFYGIIFSHNNVGDRGKELLCFVCIAAVSGLLPTHGKRGEKCVFI